MCMGGSNEGRADAKRAGNQAKKEEKRRQADIREGQGNIDQAFARFGQNFYDKFKGDFTGYYFPQLADQFRTAGGTLNAALTERGIDESTVGADENAKLARKYNDTKVDVANQSADAANQLRRQIEDEKTNLYTLNQASADPRAVNARAIGSATSLVAPQSFTPIGNVFAASVDPLVAGVKAYNRGSGPAYSSPYTVASGRGSGSVVR